MAKRFNHPAVRMLRHLAVVHHTTELSDQQLLVRFASQQDEAAFAAIVRRHGPLVLGVGRRVLGDEHAAEDVLQATFLVLARRAGSLRQPERLGSWLYGVALRTARKARTAIVRRRERESQAVTRNSSDAQEEIAQRELRLLLDDAIAGLPECYRVPIVLCYLEGRTVGEVSQKLGWPRGTVATRLSRGREQLRRGLMRRGIGLSATALALALTESCTSAAVPMRLSLTTAHAAARYAAGSAATAVVPLPVAALLQGGWRIMSWTHKKTWLATALALSTLVLGIGAGAFRAAGDEPKSAPEAASAPVQATKIPPPKAPERELLAQFRIVKGDPKDKREGAHPSILELRARTLDNQQATLSIGQDVPFIGQDVPYLNVAPAQPTVQTGYKIVYTGKFGTDPGTVVLALTSNQLHPTRTTGKRTEQRTITNQIHDTVNLGETVRYDLGRDLDNQLLTLELIVWEVKEVLVGQGGKVAPQSVGPIAPPRSNP